MLTNKLMGFWPLEGLRRASESWGGLVQLPQLSEYPLEAALLLLCFEEKAEEKEGGSKQSGNGKAQSRTKGGNFVTLPAWCPENVPPPRLPRYSTEHGEP